MIATGDRTDGDAAVGTNGRQGLRELVHDGRHQLADRDDPGQVSQFVAKVLRLGLGSPSFCDVDHGRHDERPIHGTDRVETDLQRNLTRVLPAPEQPAEVCRQILDQFDESFPATADEWTTD